MKECIFTVTDNIETARNVYKIRLHGDVSEIKVPGQFVNVSISGFFLRRPISVSYVETDFSLDSNYEDDKYTNKDGESKVNGTLTLLYKIAGKGTKALSKMERGSKLGILTGLGNGFNLDMAGETPLLLGGGIGSAPMHMLAEKLVKKGCKVTAALGFSSKQDIIVADELKKLGVKTIVATMDGSAGVKGTIADIVTDIDFSYFYACGPTPMLKAVHIALGDKGEYSLEERMGCGFGACMGCSIETASGAKRICRDGPVFEGKELIWKD